MELSDIEIRILGCLVEKAATTPDSYPLSTNALVNACNQSTNRDPVVEYTPREVDAAMLELRAGGLARTITGGRANKHRHVLDEAWGLSPASLAVLALLFLRGPQTAAELRARAERMHPFADVAEVERVLHELAAAPTGFVVHLEREPGQKERRWEHLMAAPVPRDHVGSAEAPQEGEHSSPPAASAADADDAVSGVLAALAADVDRLGRQVRHLYDLLGELPPEDGAGHA